MILKTFIFSILLSLASSSCSELNIDLPKFINGKVTRVKDGDTIEILYEGKPLTIRFAHIDCPEIRGGQPFSNTAKQFTSNLCFGQIVSIRNENEFDRYHRLIGVIINTKGDTVNLELVKAGLAWHYKQYSSNTLYSETEIIAKGKKVGLWADLNPIAPWNWR